MSERAVIPVSMLLRAGRVKRWREGRGKPFYPPLDTPPSVRIAWRFLKWLLWRTARIKQVEIHGIENLKTIKHEAALITPNHPTNLDPLVILALSKQINEPFNYVASRESFSVPVLGWILQKCGAYSITRGMADRQSIKTTRHLLAQKRKKVVIFPEGLTYGQNDTLMPFHEGVVQFGFWALEDMRKADSERHPKSVDGDAATPPSLDSGRGPVSEANWGEGSLDASQAPLLESVRGEGASSILYILPVGIRYRYLRPMTHVIETSMARLEKHIGLTPPPDATRYDRLREIGTSVVVEYERAYGVKPEKDDDLDARIQRMKEVWITRTAASIGLTLREDQTMGDKIRQIVNALDNMNAREEEPSKFTRQTFRRRQKETAEHYHDMERAGRFLAMGANYVSQDPTDERYLEVISRIEEELFGFSAPYGPRKAIVVVGDPIPLHDRPCDKTSLAPLTRELESVIAELISEASTCS